MWYHLLSLHPLVPLVLQVLVCCIHLSQISHVMSTRINFWRELVLKNQPVLLFSMSMYGSLKKNLGWRMTSFSLHLIRFIQTSSMVLQFLFYLVKLYFEIFPHPIICKTHGMLVFHLIMERINISSLIHPISHLTFPKTQRVKFLIFHHPLFMIRQIIRMSLFIILKFLIMVVMIFSFIHLITILIFLLLMFLSHQSLMIHLLMKWKLLKMLRNFSSKIA